MRFVRTEVVQAPQHDIHVPTRDKTLYSDGTILTEDVSELNGLAVPALYESHSTGKLCSMQQHCLSELRRNDAYYAVAKRTPRSMADYLRLANVYVYVTGGFEAKLEQIKKYD